MLELLNQWFSEDGFMPHGHCYLWRPELVWLHVISDVAIALAYLSIPLTLGNFVRRRRDLPFRWAFVAFGIFIISCGLTHVLEVWTLWTPLYWLSGSMKAVTAVASLTTASMLIPLVPKALALPSPSQLLSAHERATRSEARLHAATDGMIDGFVVLDAIRDAAGIVRDFRITDANAVWVTRIGLTRERILGANLLAVMPAELSSVLFPRLVQVVETRQSFEQETRMPAMASPSPLSKIRWMHYQVVALDDGLAMTARDISARRLNEEFMLRNLTDGICLIAPARNEIVFANGRLEKMFGYEPDTLEGESGNAVGVSLEKLRDGPLSYEQQEQTRSGAVIWSRTSSSALDHPEYGPVWMVLKTDITDRRSNEEATARLAAIVASTHDAITSRSLRGVIETWNAAAEHLYGYSAAEVIGRAATTLVPSTLQEEERNLLERVAHGERVEALETTRIHKSGALLDVSVTASPISTQGVVVGISSIARDISQRKRDERLLQASVNEKSVLLTEIHHRVKNNLQVVSSLLKLHAQQVTDPVALLAFQNSQTRVGAIALLHEMLYQSKDLGAVELGDYTRAVINTQVQQHAGQAVSFDVATSGVSLPMDQAMPFGMILNELITNAFKHGLTGSHAPLQVKISVAQHLEQIELLVSDNGPGFPLGFQAAATRSLGMHLIKALAGQLGGQLEFGVGPGATTKLTFPKFNETKNR